MGTEGFFDGLGQMVGKAIRFIVDLLSGVLGGLWRAMDDFFIGLLLLYSGIRAFLRRSIFGGLIWTVLGLVVLSWLIH
jgi:hypothetical protein